MTTVYSLALTIELLVDGEFTPDELEAWADEVLAANQAVGSVADMGKPKIARGEGAK